MGISSLHCLPLKNTSNPRLSPPPNKFFPANSYVFVSIAEGKRARITLPRKHHSLQEFKRLAKRVKANETQIIVKKLKSLRSLSNESGTAKHDPTKTPQDLEAQLIALKVHFPNFEGISVFLLPPIGSGPSTLRHCRPHSEDQPQPHPFRQQPRLRIPLYSASALPSPHLLHG